MVKGMSRINVQLRKLDEKNVHFYEMDIHLFKQTVIKCHFLIIKSDWIRDFSFKMKRIKLFLTAKYL